MTASRKDYELIAAELAKGWPDTSLECAGYGAAIEMVTHALAKTNPRFDRSRFREAAADART